jgi:hypothetical protein
VPVAFEHIYFKPMYYRYPTASNGRVFLMWNLTCLRV